MACCVILFYKVIRCNKRTKYRQIFIYSVVSPIADDLLEDVQWTFASDCTQERTRPSEEEELDTWSPARVRPSVALQMKTLNNLVTGCKSHRGATLIDTYRCVPRRYTAWETFMNARYESRDNNIVRVQACPWTRVSNVSRTYATFLNRFDAHRLEQLPSYYWPCASLRASQPGCHAFWNVKYSIKFLEMFLPGNCSAARRAACDFFIRLTGW